MFPFSVRRVNGSSMEPTLEDGQLVIVDRWMYKLRNPEVGDVVEVDLMGIRFVKRIVEERNNCYKFDGDNNPKGQVFGWLSQEAIKGKVVGV